MLIVQECIATKDKEFIKAAFDGLDLTDLNVYMSAKFGTEIVFKKILREIVSNYRINIECDKNFADTTGILKYSLRSVFLRDFGVTVCKYVEYDKELKEALIRDNEFDKIETIIKVVGLTVRFVIDARYELNSGGSNGIPILSAEYDLNKKEWRFY